MLRIVQIPDSDGAAEVFEDDRYCGIVEAAGRSWWGLAVDGTIVTAGPDAASVASRLAALVAPWGDGLTLHRGPHQTVYVVRGKTVVGEVRLGARSGVWSARDRLDEEIGWSTSKAAALALVRASLATGREEGGA